VEGRSFADRPVDQVPRRRLVLRKDIRLDRHQERFGGLRELGENRLAADYDNLVVVCDIGGGPDEVLELGAPLPGSRHRLLTPPSTPYPYFAAHQN
jgi:hypothetical protein